MPKNTIAMNCNLILIPRDFKLIKSCEFNLNDVLRMAWMKETVTRLTSTRLNYLKIVF